MIKIKQLSAFHSKSHFIFHVVSFRYKTQIHSFKNFPLFSFFRNSKNKNCNRFFHSFIKVLWRYACRLLLCFSHRNGYKVFVICSLMFHITYLQMGWLFPFCHSCAGRNLRSFPKSLFICPLCIYRLPLLYFKRSRIPHSLFSLFYKK